MDSHSLVQRQADRNFSALFVSIFRSPVKSCRSDEKFRVIFSHKKKSFREEKRRKGWKYVQWNVSDDGKFSCRCEKFSVQNLSVQDKHNQERERRKKSILLIKFRSAKIDKEKYLQTKAEKNVYGARRKLIKVIKRPSWVVVEGELSKPSTDTKKCFHCKRGEDNLMKV